MHDFFSEENLLSFDSEPSLRVHIVCDGDGFPVARTWSSDFTQVFSPCHPPLIFTSAIVVELGEDEEVLGNIGMVQEGMKNVYSAVLRAAGETHLGLLAAKLWVYPHPVNIFVKQGAII